MDIKFKYGLDERPPLGELVLLGLQWLAITCPTVLIFGKTMAGLYPGGPGEQVIYIQKIFFVLAVALLCQVFWGHRLPVVIGPAAVLLVGIAASKGSSPQAVYSSIMIGGLILTAVSISGLFGYVKKAFTPRVVATILILIAFTLTPTILNLITLGNARVSPSLSLCFSLSMVLIMFIADRYLKGLWKTTLIVWTIIAGTAIYYLLFPLALPRPENLPVIAPFWSNFKFGFTFDSGVVLSFLICFLALSVNDLSSIQAVGELIKPKNLQQRITRGLALTGLLNMLAGLLGVIGPVNFSLSPGVIASTRVASKYTLIPTGIGLLALSFLPRTIAVLDTIPAVVVGSSLIYIMCSQIAAGLHVLFSQGYNFDFGLSTALPLMLSIIISFLSPNVLGTFPVILRPVLGNGFVVGVVTILIMEHLVFRKK